MLSVTGSEKALKLRIVGADGTICSSGPCIPTRRDCEFMHALATRRQEAQREGDEATFNDICKYHSVLSKQDFVINIVCSGS